MKRDDIPLRTPPHSMEAETSLLGALLLDNALAERVHLSGADFYRAEHREIFEAIESLVGRSKPADVITVFEHLTAAGKADQAGGLAYLGTLAQYVPSAQNVRRYAEIIREHSTLRGLIAAADEVAQSAFERKGETVDALVDAAQMAFAKLATVKRKRDPEHISESLVAYLDLLQDMSEGKSPAMSTGLGGLDRILNGGLRRGELMVIGARPKHGKTALALAMARYLARSNTVLFLSQEMPIAQLMHRHAAAIGSIDLGRIMRADARDGELWSRMDTVARSMSELRLVHDDQCALTLLDIRRKVMQVRRRHGLDVLFVDFLQLMQGAGEDTRNRELDVIVNGIKALALELGIAVVALSQMSRKADESFHRPTITYLRDSGAIEAAADQIALLLTDHAHPLSDKNEAFTGFSELEIVAHRNGPQGLVPLHFVGQYQQFGDWDGQIPIRHVGKAVSQRGMK